MQSDFEYVQSFMDIKRLNIPDQIKSFATSKERLVANKGGKDLIALAGCICKVKRKNENPLAKLYLSVSAKQHAHIQLLQIVMQTICLQPLVQYNQISR